MRFILLVCLALISCQKEKQTPADISEGNQNHEVQKIWPNTEGSYWIYEQFFVDSTGLDVFFMQRDSVICKGDSLLEDGRIATAMLTINQDGDSSWRLLIEENGTLRMNDGGFYMSFSNFVDTIDQGDYFDYKYMAQMVDRSDTTLNFNGRSFSCVEKQYVYKKADGSTISYCAGDSLTFSYFYSPNIGLVHAKIHPHYSQHANCAFLDYRLVDYFIL